MSDENKKYERVLDLLKRAKPVFTDPEAITEKVMRQLQQEKSKVSLTELIIEYLFGWVYIGWIRRSLIATALMIVVFFGYQQTLIMKRISDLTENRIPNGGLIQTDQTDNIANRVLMYRLTGRKFSDGKTTISEKEINDLIRSVNKLKVKYKDILDMIENDPQLKKYVEEKIDEIGKN
jgi:hypothetical protein